MCTLNKIAIFFRENMEHKNLTFNNNNTMTMAPVHPLTWEPEMNIGKEDDVFILPNIALLVSDKTVIKFLSVFYFCN